MSGYDQKTSSDNRLDKHGLLENLVFCFQNCTRGLVLYERPSKLAAPISSKHFLGFNYVFSVWVWYVYLNLVDLSKKSTFCLFKTEFKAKKLFARNRCSPLRRAVHIMMAACFGKPFERGHKSKRCFFNSKNVGLSPLGTAANDSLRRRLITNKENTKHYRGGQPKGP